MVYSIGILAYGSLLDDPGAELEPLIIHRISQMTPFAVEYARLSRTRGDSATLIPVDSGGAQVPATILVLRESVKLADALDMLWRRQTRQKDLTRRYPALDGPNAVTVAILNDLGGVKTVLYTSIPSNIRKVIPQLLAKQAINSILGRAGLSKMDGIRYLHSANAIGIRTALSSAYEAEILKLSQTKDLETAIQVLDAERDKMIEDDEKSWDIFEKEFMEMAELVCHYGLESTLNDHPFDDGDYSEYLAQYEREFQINCHTGWKIAQKKIVAKMLELENEIEAAEDTLRTIQNKQGAELRALKKLISDNENKTQILRHLADTIAWQINKGELYIARQLYQKVKGHKRLSKSNIESVIEAANQLNENPENFALITDLTSYIQTGDILWIQPGEKVLGIVEVKSGSKNHEIMASIHEIIDPEIPFEQITPKIKGNKKTLEQFRRNLDQLKKGLSVASIIQNDGGIDADGKTVSIITPVEPTPRYDDKIGALGEKLKRGELWAYTTIDDCLHIGFYKKEFKIMGPLILKQLADSHGNKSIMIDYAHVINSLHRPLFTLPLPANLLYDLVFKRAKLFFLVELEPFMALFEEFGMKAVWISKSETHKILDENPSIELFTLEHQAIKLTHPDAQYPMYLNVGLFGKIYFELICPRYVAYSQLYLFKSELANNEKHEKADE